MTIIKVADSEMPAVGLGLWKVAPEDVAALVVDAIATGYRHLDSASDYANEEQVGVGIERAIADGLCRREDLWVTSKLWNTYHRAEHVAPALEKTLDDLRLDYLDLYLIHFPIALKYVPFETRYPPEWLHDPDKPELGMVFDPVSIQETWSAMEDLVRSGKVKNIGVCNFSSALLQDVYNYASIKPAMLQIESHPYLTQERLIRFAKSLGVAVTAFSPLGSLSYVELDMAGAAETVLQQPAVREAAEAHGRTPAQIVLRWGVQRGASIIPKTSRRERLLENLSLFDFQLSNEQMAAISALNLNRRFNDPGDFCEQAFGTFCPIYD